MIIAKISMLLADIDECTTSVNVHTCQQVCVNTAGGYRCECNTGFRLNLDGSACSGKHNSIHDFCQCRGHYGSVSRCSIFRNSIIYFSRH